MDISTAISTLTNIINTPKVENGGVDASGKLSANEFNAVATILNALRTLGAANSNVSQQASGSSPNDVVLYRAANSSQWTIKTLSEITTQIDNAPTENSQNAVSSGGVYFRLSELANAIENIEENVAYIGEDDGSGGVPSGGGGTPVDLTDYALKTWVAQNFLGKTSMDSTPTANSTNPVTSGGVKQYVDSHSGGGGGGGSTITTFSVTTSTNNGITTYNWGTTKYSDVKYAIEHSDEVLLNIDNGLCIMRHTETMSDAGVTSYCFFGAVAIINVGYAFASIGEGDNDSILFNWETFVPNSKQDVISDLNAIRTNAGLGLEAWNALANKQDILLEVWNMQMATDTTDPENPIYTYSIPNHTYTELMTAIENKKDILCVLMSNDVPLQYFRLNTFLGVPFFYSLSYFNLSGSHYSIAIFEVTNNNGSIVLTERSLTLKDFSDYYTRSEVDTRISQSSGGDTNVIETVKVNGTALVPDANKAVDIPVPKVAVFTSTSTESDGTYTFDFGTTKFSDIQNAIQNNDFVFLINNGVKYVYSLNLFGVLEFYTVVALENVAAMFVGLQQGENDSITGDVHTAAIVNADWNEADTSSLAFIKNKPTIPSALSELSTDATHQVVTNAEKTKWNAATKGLEKVYLAEIDDATTAGIYEVVDPTASGVPYLLMVETRLSVGPGGLAQAYVFQVRVTSDAISKRQQALGESWSGWTDIYSSKYTKPSGGIPKSDLDSNVQSSLDKADSALQSFTESDPTVPAWAKEANKPSYTPQEIGALPNTYTPPVLSVNGQTGAVTLNIPTAVTESTVSNWGFTKNTGTYSKPAGGIPESDIAAGVIPTKVSDLTNDSGFVTDSAAVTIYSGTTNPSSSLGNNGDIYIKTS